jgi:hypothetical protein
LGLRIQDILWRAPDAASRKVEVDSSRTQSLSDDSLRAQLAVLLRDCRLANIDKLLNSDSRLFQRFNARRAEGDRA